MNIIILNGPSSVGKTSIGKHLQDIIEEPYVILGLDHIIETMPRRTNDYNADMQPREGFYWIAGVDEDGAPLMHLTPGAYGQKIYKALIAQVKCFADNGLNVIVDHVSLMDDYQLWRDALSDHQVIYCGITARQEILDQREKERGDRVVGGSRAQMMIVHDGYQYDICIDTSSMSSEVAAEKIYVLVKGLDQKYSMTPCDRDIP
jgi:chloramphenicol 3-O phosphotransferase